MSIFIVAEGDVYNLDHHRPKASEVLGISEYYSLGPLLAIDAGNGLGIVSFDDLDELAACIDNWREIAENGEPPTTTLPEWQHMTWRVNAPISAVMVLADSEDHALACADAYDAHDIDVGNINIDGSIIAAIDGSRIKREDDA